MKKNCQNETKNTQKKIRKTPTAKTKVKKTIKKK